MILLKKIKTLRFYDSIAAPLLIVIPLLFPFFIHSFLKYDIQYTWRWMLQLTSIQRTYVDSETNYPIIGALATSWLAKLIRLITPHLTSYFAFSGFAFTYRAALAIFDSANACLMAILARQLGFRFPHLVALLIFLLPSTWVMGACWGQVDNVSLLFFLLSSVLYVHVSKSIQNKSSKILLLYPAFVFSILLFLCTKQTFIFTAIVLGVLSVLSGFSVFKTFSKRITMLTVGAASLFILFFLIIDHWFILPPPYRSHLMYVFSVAPERSTGYFMLSKNGFSVWNFMQIFNPNSAFITIFAGLTPWFVGRFIAALFLLATLCCVVAHSLFGSVQDLEGVRMGIFLAAFINLPFNLFLTGLHERHLYLFYPVILITFYAIKDRVRNEFQFRLILASLIVGAFFYGLFAYSLISSFWQWKQRLLWVSAYHIFLFCCLLMVWVRIEKNWIRSRRHTAD